VSTSKIKEEDVATEIYLFKMFDDGTVYPAPRWLGSLLAAVGARRAEELNYKYFDNNMFIPFVILVSGGVLTSDSMERIKKQLEEGKGDKEPFRALILEAMPMDGSSSVFEEGRSATIRIEIKPLIETVKDDMLFSAYDDQSRNKQRLAFRLPKILLGEAEEYNRATAESALSIVNAQVFDVERDEFDDFVNRKLFPMKGFIYHRFKSLPYKASDPQVLSEVLNTLSQTGVLSPATALATASEILGRELVLPDAEYIKYPFPLVQALILMEVFGLKELQGDMQVPEEFRGKSREEIKKWVIDLLQINPVKPALDAEVSDDVLDELT
jgi:capsid portal protein